MRILKVALVALPLLAFGCKDKGEGQAEDNVTKQPRSGGYTPENNSAAYRPGDKGSPSGAQTGVLNSDAGANPAAATVPALPGKPPPPPPTQKETPTPKGEAGGTLKKVTD